MLYNYIYEYNFIFYITFIPRLKPWAFSLSKGCKEFSFKDHTFKSKDDGVSIKYYKFMDDNEKNINFYDEKPSEDIFDEDSPSEEGVLKIDGDKASITTELNGEMTFERKN